MTTIHDPITLAGAKLPNRLVKAAMSEALCGRNGLPNSELIQLYKTWADSSMGMLITGNVMVDPGALGEPGNCVIEADTPLEPIKAWSAAAKSAGSACVVQISHPGKQAPKGLNKQTVGPSAVPFSKEMQAFFAIPKELSVDEIAVLVERFADTAARCEAGGFDGVQIHGAHGYLVSAFLSPKHNIREDNYGGSIENRMRFLTEIVTAISAKTSEGFVLGVKLNSADFQRGGFSEEDSTTVIQKLESMGVDFVEVSGGTYEAPAMTGVKSSTKAREAYFLEFAEKLRAQTKIKLMVTGGFRTQPAMDAALASGALDLIGVARPLAIEPDVADRWLEGKQPKHEIKPIKTHLPPVDNAGLLEIFWYAAQFKDMGQGKAPNPKLSPYKVLFHYIKGNVKAMIKGGKKKPSRLRAK